MRKPFFLAIALVALVSLDSGADSFFPASVGGSFFSRSISPNGSFFSSGGAGSASQGGLGSIAEPSGNQSFLYLEAEKAIKAKLYNSASGTSRIQALTVSLTLADRKDLYQKRRISVPGLASLGNTFYGVGSWLQGDYVNGAIVTSLMIGGLSFILASTTDSSSDTAMAIGACALSGGMIYGWICPFTYETQQAKRVRKALLLD